MSDQLIMQRDEFDLWEKEISECVRLLGQRAVLYPVTFTEDLYHDKNTKNGKGRDIGILFETNPRPILKKSRWLTEDEELPFIAYVVPLDINDKAFTVSEQMQIDITTNWNIYSAKQFTVQKVRGSTIDPLMFICNLTPKRPKVAYSVKPDTSTTYLKDFFDK